MIGVDIYSNNPGIIVKSNGNGKAIESFAVLNSFSILKTILAYVSVTKAIFRSDSSFILGSYWSFYEGEFGISSISAKDFCFFKINSNKDFEWSTSIDYGNDYEEYFYFLEYNNTLFISQVSAKYYFCLEALDIQTGTILNYKWLYINKLINITEYRSYYISHISERGIFTHAFLPTNTVYLKMIIIMHDYKTFEVKKTYKIDHWGTKAGLWTQNNDRGVFYWFYMSSILSVYLDESADR